MALWTSDKYSYMCIRIVTVTHTRNDMGAILVYIQCESVILVYIRTNMYICVPVLILCPIIGLIWVLSSYISSAKGDILVYTQCAGGYIQGEHPWRGYIPGEKPYQSGYGTTDG